MNLISSKFNLINAPFVLGFAQCFFANCRAKLSLLNCAVLIMLGLMSNASYAIERLQLATQQWPPYQTLNDGKMGGIAVERVQCSLRKMGQPYQLHMMRWDKAQLLVETS